MSDKIIVAEPVFKERVDEAGVVVAVEGKHFLFLKGLAAADDAGGGVEPVVLQRLGARELLHPVDHGVQQVDLVAGQVEQDLLEAGLVDGQQRVARLVHDLAVHVADGHRVAERAELLHIPHIAGRDVEDGQCLFHFDDAPRVEEGAADVFAHHPLVERRKFQRAAHPVEEAALLEDALHRIDEGAGEQVFHVVLAAPGALEHIEAERFVLEAEDVLEFLEIDDHFGAGFGGDDAGQVEDLVAGDFIKADFEGEERPAVHFRGAFAHPFAPERGEIREGADVEQVDFADDQIAPLFADLFDRFADDGLLAGAGAGQNGEAPAARFQGGDNGSDFLAAAEDTASGSDLIECKREIHPDF